MSRHHDELYLRHMRAACDQIARYLAGVSWAAFEQNPEKQDAVIRQLEILGEAAGRLSAPFRQAHPEMPWQRIKDLRNVLIHGYAHVDLTRVWQIARDSVPALRHAVDQALRAQDTEWNR